VTIIVSVKINDGIVMAADSAGTMGSGQIYAHANKITNLCDGLSIGAMSTGAGGIGAYMEDQQFANKLPELYAAVVLVSLLGLAVNAGLRVVQRRTLFWAGEERSAQ